MISRAISGSRFGAGSPEMLADVETMGLLNFGDEVRCDARRAGEDQRQGRRGHLLHLEGDAGCAVDIPHGHVGRAAQHEHRFFVLAAFERIDPCDGLFVGCVAADPPHGVGRVEDDASLSKHLDGCFDLLLQFVFCLLHGCSGELCCGCGLSRLWIRCQPPDWIGSYFICSTSIQ